MYSFLITITSLATLSHTVFAQSNQCGATFGGAKCADGSCCSQYGYCGITLDFCGTGCQSNCVYVPLTTFTKCTKPKQVALTFDDGISPYTNTLLDMLQQNNVKATFFVIGQKLTTSTNKKILKRMIANGHNVGSHTYTHPDLTQLNQTQITKEMTDANNLMRSITGKAPVYFRPPYLALNPTVSTVIKTFNYKTIMVGLDSLDWQYQATDPQQIYRNVVNNYNKSSYIVLQHDTYQPSVALVPNIISAIRQGGLTLVNMDQCLS